MNLCPESTLILFSMAAAAVVGAEGLAQPSLPKPKRGAPVQQNRGHPRLLICTFMRIHIFQLCS